MNTPNEKEILHCGHPASDHESFTTGYGVDVHGKTSCYDCCAKSERESMDATGKATLYLSRDKETGGYKVQDWPGKLSYPVTSFRVSYHNIAGPNGRIDFWFKDHAGARWHGYQIGRCNEIAHCKRMK